MKDKYLVKKMISFLILTLITMLISCGKKENPNNVQQMLPIDVNIKVEDPKSNQKKVMSQIEKIDLSSYSNIPHIFFIMIDTLRFDMLPIMPNLQNFKKSSLPIDQGISGATATEHSLYTLFFSKPASERDQLIQDSYSIGAPSLHLFKKLGLKINLYGLKEFFYRPDEDLDPKNYQWDDPSYNLQLIFGNKGKLVDEIFSYSLAKANNVNVVDSLEDNIDYQIYQKVKKNLTKDIPPAFHFIYFFSNHDLYKYSNDIPLINKRACNNYFTLSDFNKCSNEQKILSYQNASRTIDVVLGKLYEYLKEQNLYDNSIILTFSDHGEALDSLGKGEYGYHGAYIPYWHQIEVPIFIKIPQKLKEKLQFEKVDYISSLNIIPTIFDLLDQSNSKSELTTLYSNYTLSKSILNRPEPCAVTFRPNGLKKAKDFIVTDGKYKMFGELIRNSNSSEPGKLVFNNFTNTRDEPIAQSSFFSKQWILDTFDECLNLIGVVSH